jgi:tRNA(fMet)-specific endonuclease VapC
MRDFLLDTQTICYWYDNTCIQHQPIIDNIQIVQVHARLLSVEPKFLVSVVTLGEIEFGHRVALAPNPAKQAAFMKFIQEKLPNNFEVSRDAAQIYGELRTKLFNKYAPGEKRKPKMRPEQLVDPVTAKELTIQENDLWLCAQAAAHGMVLVTNDRMPAIRDVATGMTPPLLVQNWSLKNTASIPS